MTNQREEVLAASAWLEQEAARMAFGEVGVTLIVHDGNVVRIERCVVKKTVASAGRDKP
ncbi:MAG: DUF2292 domain-containing protein [Methanothrix sp.]|nr:MAG: DUF2292 domain-containing protein [Methanothrix sp.]